MPMPGRAASRTVVHRSGAAAVIGQPVSSACWDRPIANRAESPARKEMT